MSEIQVTSLDSTGQLSANVITAGNTTVNSSGLYLSGSNGIINTSAIKVTSDTGDRTILPIIVSPSITVNGTSYSSLTTESVNTQMFTANGTWTKPSWANTGNELVIVHLWGGGGGGNTTGAGAGGGGAMVYGYFKTSQCNSVCNVHVGIGGIAGSTGGNSIFFANTTKSLTAYGGGPANTTFSGGGGGWFGVGLPIVSGGPLNSTFGGGYSGDNSIYGGGGGFGGNSIYGGGGGRGPTGNLGTSVYGGFGANSSVAASVPGGGGAGSNNTSGARGEVRVYTLRITGNV